MSSLMLQQRKQEIDSFIENKSFEDDKLVYSFVLHLYSNREIDECIDYVKKLCTRNDEKNLVYYKLWYVSLLYLRGYFEEAKQEFFALHTYTIPNQIKDFYLKKLGFDELYDTFITIETK